MKRELQSHPTIDSMDGATCCLLCGTLADPFIGCDHVAAFLYESMKNIDNTKAEMIKDACLYIGNEHPLGWLEEK